MHAQSWVSCIRKLLLHCLLVSVSIHLLSGFYIIANYISPQMSLGLH